jgi:DNA-binding PadR family transcriptional regulator
MWRHIKDYCMEQPDHLPLSEAIFCILLSLTAGARHGYAILLDVRALSDGRIVLSTGTLYGALKRLLEAGWIRRADGPAPEDEIGRKQKSYMLTDQGQRIFDAERARMRALLAVAQQRAEETR